MSRTPRGGASRGEVWVVEDDRALLTGMLTLLEERGHRVRGFADPIRALRDALESPPRVLVTDYQMPGLDGVELARALRDKLGPNAPRIFLVTGTRVRRVDQTQFDQVLHKPFRFADLLATIERGLATPRRRESHQRIRRSSVAGNPAPGSRASSDDER